MRQIADPAILTALKNLAMEGEKIVKASMKKMGFSRTAYTSRAIRTGGVERRLSILRSMTERTKGQEKQLGQLTRYAKYFSRGIQVAKIRGKPQAALAHGIPIRSAPGDPPAIQTKWLYDNITHEVDPKTMASRFGSNVPYDKYLELGTRKMPARPHYRPVVKQLDIPAGFRAAFATAGRD
jgi:hypothetical protein